jgi:hypothetical protein
MRLRGCNLPTTSGLMGYVQGRMPYAPTAWLDRIAVGAYGIRPKNQAEGVIPGERFFAPTRNADHAWIFTRRDRPNACRGEKIFARPPDPKISKVLDGTL